MQGRISATMIRGNLEVRKLRRQIRRRNALKRRLGKIVCGIVLLALAGTVVYGLAGCATTPLAIANPLEELKQPIVLSDLVQVAQMGVECKSKSEENEVKRIIRETMSASGALTPDTIKIRLLSGSSLCGPAQGMAESVKMPELGAYSTARAEVSLSWKGGIAESELEKAKRALNLLRATPIRPSSKVARNPANKK